MPTVLGKEFPPTHEQLPARMAPEDFDIWIRWRPKFAGKAIRFYFDVGLGKGAEVPEEVDPRLAPMWLKNTQKRADVIMETRDEVWIIELRHMANPNCVGRILMYERLWRDDPAIDKPHKLFIVTNSYDPDVEELCKDYAIEYHVV